MMDEDYPAFEAALFGLSGILGRRIPAETAAMYFRVLRDVEWLPLKAAMESLARRIETTGRLPAPRDLRALATGAEVSATGELIDGAILRQVEGRVMQAMSVWCGTGSARPAFDAAWRDALEDEGVRTLQVAARESCWQMWLHAGTRLTEDHIRGILADVAPLAKPAFGRAVGVEPPHLPPPPEPEPEPEPEPAPPPRRVPLVLLQGMLAKLGAPFAKPENQAEETEDDNGIPD